MITEPPPTPPVVAILGAGPAGMSCANACLSFGLAPVVLERDDHAGGAQRSNFHPNLWMLGAPGESGETMTRRMAEHFRSLPVPTRYRAEIAAVERKNGRFHLHLEAGDSLWADAIVLATGLRPRATPALEKLAGASSRVIIGPLSSVIRDGIRDTDVLILGGADNALDHALFLAEKGNRCVVCARGAFAARAAFLDACARWPGIELRPSCATPELIPLPTGLRAAWPDAARDFGWLLVMYGYRPNTEVLDRFAPALRPALTADGHVRVDAWQRTDVPGLYAAGDLTGPPQPAVPTAIAQGLAAARAIERDGREANPGH